MASVPYVDSLWTTKKRQIPFLVGNVTIIWETSYGMTIKNPGGLPSDELRRYVDDAIERGFAEDLDKFTNNRSVRTLIDHAGMYIGLDQPVEVHVALEGVDGEPIVTSAAVGETREINHMTIDELIRNGFLSNGVRGGGGGE